MAAFFVFILWMHFMAKVNLTLMTICLFISSIANSAEFRHCSLDENVVFSCAVGEKIASICASKDSSMDSGYAQYRFGLPDKTEFNYPENKMPANINFTIKYDLESSYISFKDNLLTYKLKLSKNTSAYSVIEVSNSEKIISSTSCTSTAIVSDKDELISWGFKEVLN